MKKIFAAFAILGFMACNAIEQPAPMEPWVDQEGGTVLFTLGGEASGPSIESRATSAGSEETVSSFKLVLFKGSTVYAVKDANANSNTVALNVEEGTYDCYALVNAPTSLSVTLSTTKTQFEALTSAITDNSMSKFVMSGCAANQSITSSTTSVTIPVFRHIAKIEIDKISVNFDGTYYDTKPLKINKIYLTNLSTKAYYYNHTPFASTVSETWYNKLAYSSVSSIDAMVYEAPSSGITINDNNSKTDVHYFYAYPNPSTATASLTAWPSSGNAPCTRLVFECTLDSKTTYYHIDIPGMTCNTLYKITECTIKNMGGKDPEHNLQTKSISFTIQIQPWATGFTSSYTFDDSGVHAN